MNVVNIVGCGLIGGSIAKDLISVGVKVNVVDKNPDLVANFVHGVNFCSDVATMPTSDLTIVSVPFCSYFDVINAVDSGSCKLITDVASVQNLPQRKKIDNFIGSHPIAGKENSGTAYSTTGLFRDKKIIISQQHALLESFWSLLGGIVEVLDPVDHDKIYAKVSHLVHFVCFCFSDFVLDNNLTKEDTHLLASYPKYKNFRRIGFANRSIWNNKGEIFSLNKSNIKNALKHFVDLLKAKQSDSLCTLSQAISCCFELLLDTNEYSYCGSAFTSVTSMKDTNIFSSSTGDIFDTANFADYLIYKFALIC